MEINETIWKELDRIRPAIPLENIIPAVIRIVFVKYAADNYLFSETKEDMKIYANIHKSIANKDIDALLENAAPMLEMIDGKINANGILSRSVIGLQNDLLGKQYVKNPYSEETAQRLLGFLCSLNFDDDSADKEAFSNYLVNFIYGMSTRSGKYGGEYYSSKSINELARRLIKISDNDYYRDFACGCGLSDMCITEGKGIHQSLSDMNEELVQLAIMLHIMRGYDMDKIRFAVCDVFEMPSNEERYSKIFSDFPFGIKLNKQTQGYRDGTVYAIHKMMDELKEGGTAVITCPPSILTRTDKETTLFRKELLTKKLLKSVITLPPVMIGTLINVNLLILSKENNDLVLLIDASKNDVIQFSNNSRKASSELTSSGINEICRIAEENVEVSGVSKIVKTEQLLVDNSISPQYYVEQIELENVPSQKEIWEQLDDLYEALMNSLKYR